MDALANIWLLMYVPYSYNSHMYFGHDDDILQDNMLRIFVIWDFLL